MTVKFIESLNSGERRCWALWWWQCCAVWQLMVWKNPPGTLSHVAEGVCGWMCSWVASAQHEMRGIVHYSLVLGALHVPEVQHQLSGFHNVELKVVPATSSYKFLNLFPLLLFLTACDTSKNGGIVRTTAGGMSRCCSRNRRCRGRTKMVKEPFPGVCQCCLSPHLTSSVAAWHTVHEVVYNSCHQVLINLHQWEISASRTG